MPDEVTARTDSGRETVDGGPRGPNGGRLVHRPPATVRPHRTYQACCGSIAATRVRRVAQQRGPIREPLLTTTAGIILDGHARWQVALDRQQPTLPCIEYDLTEDEALQSVIQHHRASEGLNDFCRIVMALALEPYFRECSHRRQRTTGARPPSSNLTNDEHRDVRKDIARVAGVSTGNVTKVKQLLGSVIPATRGRLLQGEISIHRAWQWRTLTASEQRDALWAHLHRGAIKRTIDRLVRAHADARPPAQPDDVAATVLSKLASYDAADLTVAIVDVPGRAVVVTRAFYDEPQEKKTR